MIKSSFPFLNSNLNFDAKKHKYTCKGIEYLSVTKWLSQFDKPFNPYKISEQVSKNPNSEYYRMKPEDIRSLWIKTGSRGTKHHNQIENWIVGKTDTCKEKDFLEDLGITPSNTWSEVPLISNKLQLAGTADLITQTDEGLVVWDIKTSKKVDSKKILKFTLQICTYGYMISEMANKEVEVFAGGIILISPKGNISEGVEEIFNEPELIKVDYIPDGFKEMIGNRKYQIK